MADNEILEMYRNAREHMDRGAFQEAIEILTRILHSGYDSPELHASLGECFVGLGRCDEAVGCYWEAIHRNPRLEYYDGLAQAYYNKGWWDEAVAYWEEALKFRPDDPALHYKCARAYYNKGWWNEAIHHLYEAIKQEEHNPRLWYALAVCLRMRGQQDEASEYLERACELAGGRYREYFERHPEDFEVPAGESAPAPAETEASERREKVETEEMKEEKKEAKAGSRRKGSGTSRKKKASSASSAAKSGCKRRSSAKSSGKGRKARNKIPMVEAAYMILSEERSPLHYKEITRRALDRGLISSRGSTPEQTLRTAISREINKRGEQSRFEKLEGGYYALTEWKK